MKTIVILGGGLSGLAAAEKLCKNYKIILLEKEEVLGGLARSYNYQNVWIPLTYHHVMKVDKTTIDYIKEYGLLKYLNWNSINMAFWFDKKQFLLTKPHHILNFKPLSLKSRFNLAKFGCYVRLKQSWKRLEGIPADQWLTEFVGKEATEKLFKNLAEIKFGELSSVDAAWFASRLGEAAKTRDNYAYLSCGYQKLIDGIADMIREKGGKIETKAIIKKIKGNKVDVLIKGKLKSFKADKIISSLPPKTLSKISDLPKETKTKLKAVDYKAIICMVLLSKQKFLKEYWNIFIEPKLSFGGIFNHSALYPKQLIERENLYYVFKYVNSKDKFYKFSEKKIREKFVDDLNKLCPNLTISWSKIFKIKESSSVYSKDYKNLPIRLIKDVYLTGVYKEYPCTRTMHTALKSGLNTANVILNERDMG